MNGHEALAGRTSIDRWGLAVTAVVLVTWTGGLFLGFRAALAVLTAVGFVAAVAGYFAPRLGLLGVGLLCTLDGIGRALVFDTGGLLRWNTLNYWLLAVIGLEAAALAGLKDVQTRILALFALFLALGLLYTQDVRSGLSDVLNVVSAFGLLAYFGRAHAERAAWFWLAVVCGTAGAAGAVVYVLQEASLPYVNHNVFAYLPLTGLLAICLGFAFAADRRGGRALLLALAGACLAGVFLSGSRGGLLVGLVCAAHLLFSTRKVAQALSFAAVATLLVFSMFLLFPAQSGDSLRRIEKAFSEDESYTARTSGRLDLALGGWRILRHYPLGVGTGGFSKAWTSLGSGERGSGFREGTATPAHSAWVKVLAESGPLGLLLLAGFVGSFAILGWQRQRHGLLLPGLFGSVALGGAFLSAEFQNKGLWLLAAGLMTLLRCLRVPEPGRAA